MLSNTGTPSPPKHKQMQIHRAEEAREREQDGYNSLEVVTHPQGRGGGGGLGGRPWGEGSGGNIVLKHLQGCEVK